MSEPVRVDGVQISPATVQGNANVFMSSDCFVLVKPRWIPDEESSACLACASKFTSLRRKHHCRQCGFIFCNKCCFEKIPLPQFGTASQDRVCENCKLSAKLIAMAISQKLPEKLRGAQGLVDMLDSGKGTKQLLESGGVQALVHAAKLRDEQLRTIISGGFSTLSTNSTLLPYLLQSGAIRAITRMLEGSDARNETLISNCLCVLTVFCNSPQLIPQVLEAGVLDPVLSLIGGASSALTLMALKVLCVLVEDNETHQYIVTHKNAALSRIFRCAQQEDEHMQETALRVLSLMALGSDLTRQHIAQEDILSGHTCQRVLCSRPHNIQVLVNAACLVANLAASEQTQGALKDLLLPLCRLMHDCAMYQDLMNHTARGIANFARNQNHAHLLVPYVASLFSLFVKSPEPPLRYQGLRTIISLMTFFPQQTLVLLQQQEIIDVVKVLAERVEVMEAIHTAILQAVPLESRPT